MAEQIISLPKEYSVETPVVDLVNDILAQAQSARASDIHIDPQQHSTLVRFRIDGLLQKVATIPKVLHQEVIARLKIMSGLRTDERLLPQDGRCSIGEQFDMRVTTVASYYGESMVLRLLERTIQIHSLTSLGFSLEQQNTISQILTYPQGLILVTGPTGSGKTTTLYTLLNLLHRSTHSIITLEDPIEYAMPGIRQLHVQPKRGLTFANGLRSILRQDPDIIMIGEMRDTETAQLALQAAMTGHLVLSTLHTNSAVSSVLRLFDMGIESYMISATIRLIINQRLARVVCQKCARVRKINKRELDFVHSTDFQTEISEVVESVGCENCQASGYYGRTVVSEVLAINDEVRASITDQTTTQRLEKIAHKKMLSLQHAGIEKCLNKITTFDEIIRLIQH